MSRTTLFKLLRELFKEQRGKAVSDLDDAYRRGWREAIRSVRQRIEQTP